MSSYWNDAFVYHIPGTRRVSPQVIASAVKHLQDPKGSTTKEIQNYLNSIGFNMDGRDTKFSLFGASRKCNQLINQAIGGRKCWFWGGGSSCPPKKTRGKKRVKPTCCDGKELVQFCATPRERKTCAKPKPKKKDCVKPKPKSKLKKVECAKPKPKKVECAKPKAKPKKDECAERKPKQKPKSSKACIQACIQCQEGKELVQFCATPKALRKPKPKKMKVEECVEPEQETEPEPEEMCEEDYEEQEEDCVEEEQVDESGAAGDGGDDECDDSSSGKGRKRKGYTVTAKVHKCEPCEWW